MIHTAMNDVLRKIHAVFVTNTEIIERVESQETTISFSYQEEWDAHHRLTIKEIEHSRPTKDILQEWSTTAMDFESNLCILMDGADLFLADLEARTTTWEVTKRLNAAMLVSVEKLAGLLDPNPKNEGPEEELRKYLRNYERLQVAFGEVEEKTMNRESKLAELTEKADMANEAIGHAQTAILNCNADMTSTLISYEEEKKLKEWFCSNGSALRILYRGSRDGMEASTFHRLCDDRGPTLTIIKSSEGYTFGGYTEASWGSEGYVEDNKTALFTLRNPHRILPQHFAGGNGNPAIFAHHLRGPAFGSRNLGFDLSTGTGGFIGNYTGSRFGRTFSDSTGKGPLLFTGERKFSIADIEVLKVEMPSKQT